MIDKSTTAYEKACVKLTKAFVKRYFEDTIFGDGHFVADDVTGVFDIADMFFSIEHMYQYMKYDYTFEELYDRYHDDIEATMEGNSFPNIRTWKLLFNKED